MIEKDLTHVVQVIVLCAQYVVLAGSFRWPVPELPQSVKKVLQFIAVVACLQSWLGHFAWFSLYELKLRHVGLVATQPRDTEISRLVAEVAVEVE
jgi:hypothetical protein